MDKNDMYTEMESKEPVFKSSSVMTRDFYIEFFSVSYNMVKKLALTFLCFTALITAINIKLANTEIAVFNIFITLILGFMYFMYGKMTKLNYERQIIAAGKESTLNENLFEDKMTTDIDGIKREYSFDQVTNFFETKNLILLHLKHQLYFTVNKNTLNADISEVKTFLNQKCSHVKNKHFTNCSKDKSLTLIFIILQAMLSVISLAVSLLL